MTARVGVVGCGDVARSYAENARAYSSYELVACAARTRASAEAFAARHGLHALSLDELLASADVDIVLNLTPVEAHAEISAAAIARGKHVYSEKALAATAADGARLVAEAQRHGVRLACAPDIFLGPPYQGARALLDAGAIGEPVAVSAAMLEGGPEERHPNPDIFYGPRSGPLLDLGPYSIGAIVTLLGPVRRVTGFASTRRSERTIATGRRAGERFPVQAATHVAASLELASGATANLVTSYEAPGQYVCDLAIHGSAGSLELPDPTWHGGTVRVRHGQEDWREHAFAARPSDFRGPGLDDLARALAADRPHRAAAEVALHVLDVGSSILEAARTGSVVEVRSTCERPAPLVKDVDRSGSRT